MVGGVTLGMTVVVLGAVAITTVLTVGAHEGTRLGDIVGTMEVGDSEGTVDGANVGVLLGVLEGRTVGRIVLTMYTALDHPPPHSSPVVAVHGIVHMQLVVAPVQLGPHWPY